VKTQVHTELTLLACHEVKSVTGSYNIILTAGLRMRHARRADYWQHQRATASVLGQSSADTSIR